MDSNSPLMPQFANVPEITMPTMPEMPSVQQDFIGGLQGLNKQIMDQQDKERQKALEAFEFHRKYTGNKELAWQSFMNSGKLPANYQPTKEDRKLFEQEMDADQQRTRMSLYGDQLTDAQKRGDAESIIALTEKIYGQPLDESRKDYIRTTSQVSQLQDMSSIIENLKNSPPTASYPIVKKLLESRGMPVPSYADFVATYYAPRAGTAATVDQRKMEAYSANEQRIIKTAKENARQSLEAYKTSTNDNGAAARDFLTAIDNRDAALSNLLSAIATGDASVIEGARQTYQRAVDAFKPASERYTKSIITGVQATAAKSNADAALARIEIQRGQLGLNRERLAMDQKYIAAKINQIKELLPYQVQNFRTTIDARVQMIPPTVKLKYSQIELNKYLQNNSNKLLTAGLILTAAQDRSLEAGGESLEKINESRSQRLSRNLDLVVDGDVTLRDYGVDRKYQKNQDPNAESAVQAVRNMVGLPATSQVKVAPPTTGASQKTGGLRVQSEAGAKKGPVKTDTTRGQKLGTADRRAITAGSKRQAQQQQQQGTVVRTKVKGAAAGIRDITQNQ